MHTFLRGGNRLRRRRQILAPGGATSPARLEDPRSTLPLRQAQPLPRDGHRNSLLEDQPINQTETKIKAGQPNSSVHSVQGRTSARRKPAISIPTQTK